MHRQYTLVPIAALLLLACSGTDPVNQNLGGNSSTVNGGTTGSPAVGGSTTGGGLGGGATTGGHGVPVGGRSSNLGTTSTVGGNASTGGTGASSAGGSHYTGGTSSGVGGKATGGGSGGANPTGGVPNTGGASLPSTGGNEASGGTSSQPTAGGNATGGNATGGNATGGANGTSAACLAATFLSSLGKTSPFVGASMQDSTANAAPFDGRYLYLSGGYFDGAEPCASCASGCTADGASCSNAGDGCAWWGCWQWDQDPPGQYVVSFVSAANSATYGGQTNPQIPLITYYQVLQASGVDEGAAEVAALDNQAFLHKYFADFRLVLQKVGNSKALLHLEPDFWGYVEQSGGNPHVMPAPVSAANATDCASAEDSVAGFARCLIAMARKYAPNSRIGLHASGWGTNYDVLHNTNASLDVVAEARKLGNYLLELGAADGDFVVADMSDRDAGYYQQQGRNTFWDTTNAKLPNFSQAFKWAKAVSETVGKPILWWQIPVGHMAQNNTPDHYQDNRVDYLLSHMDEVVAANGAGLFFGAGAGGQTTPESDGGNLVAKVKAYAANPAPACP